MSFVISSAIEDLKLETLSVGTYIDNADFILAFNRANEYFNSHYKMPTTERMTDLLAYPNVLEYSVPSDFGGLIEPRRPYALTSPNFTHQTANELTHYRHGKLTAFKFNRDTQFLLANDPDGESATIHNFEDNTTDGIWSISGDGSALTVDENIYTQGIASLRFTITASGGTTTLVNSTIPAIDLTDYEDVARFFADLQAPAGNTADLTSVRLRIGSSASAYWQFTATTRHRGDSLGPSWGQISWDWATDTVGTGSPSITSITYAQLVITHAASGTTINGQYRIDNLFAALPVYYQLPYYSSYNIENSASVFQQRITAVTDTIHCPIDCNNALVFKALEYLAVYKIKDQGLASYAARELEPYEMTLKAKYPNQERYPQTTWYKRANKF